jgi:hypothetical protein
MELLITSKALAAFLAFFESPTSRYTIIRSDICDYSLSHIMSAIHIDAFHPIDFALLENNQ